ncbi:hypothetical protein MMC17_002788 [Xylographa soralifera]|nr:hypothetical protein [Xylographa soralifera]
MSRWVEKRLGERKRAGADTDSEDAMSYPTTGQAPREKTGLFEFTEKSSEEEGLIDIVARWKRIIDTMATRFHCLTNLNQSSLEQARIGTAQRTKGTCTWILEDGMYQDWLMPDTSKLLWVSRDPECVKSVLSTFIVDHIRESLPASTVCYFFCDDKVELQKTVVSLLRSILHQLLSTKTALLQHVLPQFRVKGAAIVTEESSLWDFLIACLNDPISGSVICIIDALDECESCGRIWFSQKPHEALFTGERILEPICNEVPLDQ